MSLRYPYIYKSLGVTCGTLPPPWILGLIPQSFSLSGSLIPQSFPVPFIIRLVPPSTSLSWSPPYYEGDAKLLPSHLPAPELWSLCARFELTFVPSLCYSGELRSSVRPSTHYAWFQSPRLLPLSCVSLPHFTSQSSPSLHRIHPRPGTLVSLMPSSRGWRRGVSGIVPPI